MTRFQQLQDELAAINEQIIGLCGNTARRPLIDRANGIKAQLKAFTVYNVAGYSRGSTNGQRPIGHCIVITKGDKKDAIYAGRKQLGAYKALGSRLRWDVDLKKQAEQTARLWNHGLPIIEA